MGHVRRRLQIDHDRLDPEMLAPIDPQGILRDPLADVRLDLRLQLDVQEPTLAHAALHLPNKVRLPCGRRQLGRALAPPG